MTFEVDDWVVHPQHGVGRVIKLEIRQFDSGSKQLYYKISILNGILWVQVDGSSCGLRKVTAKCDLDKYRDLLKSPPTPLTADHRQRLIELTERYRQGSFQARCEVVRDLTAFGWYKPLGEANATLLRVAHQALYQEWATAEGVTLNEATREVEALLQEGKHLHKK
jgi:RNA polymerase-interacting CarD/CdnL/TRCF family regulator